VSVLSCFIISVFFFSSRRRHTRFSRDWSSDVCSSDLPLNESYVREPQPLLIQRSVEHTLQNGQDENRRDQQANDRKGRRSHCERSEERRVGKECRSRWSPND